MTTMTATAEPNSPKRPMIIEITTTDGNRMMLRVDAIESVRAVPDPDYPHVHIRTRSGDYHNVSASYADLAAVVRAHAGAGAPVDVARGSE